MEFPCAYLIGLGTVGEKRDDYDIAKDVDDHHVVCRYGWTHDLKSVLHGHTWTAVLQYACVDEEHASDAGIKMYSFFDQRKLWLDDKAELVIIHPSDDDSIHELYSEIYKLYGGRVARSLDKIRSLKIEVENMGKCVKEACQEINDLGRENKRLLSYQTRYERIEQFLRQLYHQTECKVVRERLVDFFFSF